MKNTKFGFVTDDKFYFKSNYHAVMWSVFYLSFVLFVAFPTVLFVIPILIVRNISSYLIDKLECFCDCDSIRSILGQFYDISLGMVKDVYEVFIKDGVKKVSEYKEGEK